MARSTHDIARDLKAAVEAVGESIREQARLMGAPPPPAGAKSGIEVLLADGRRVEIGALADELLSGPDHGPSGDRGEDKPGGSSNETVGDRNKGG